MQAPRRPPNPKPWEQLPAEVAALLRPIVTPLAQEIIDSVQAAVPAYAQPLDGPFGRDIKLGAEQGLRRFVMLIEGPAEQAEAARNVYRALGRTEHMQGRSLDALQAAYRLGARITWRRLAEEGRAAGLSPETLDLLAEAIFAYIDELAGESVEGYAEAQAAHAGERDRQRQRLLELVANPEPDEAAISEAARQARWQIPRYLAAVAVSEESSRPVARRIGPDVLVGSLFGLGVLLIPDPGGPRRRQLVTAALDQHVAAVGPTVAWREAARSVQQAVRVLELAQRGVLDAHMPLQAEDHLSDVVLLQDPELAAALVAHHLQAFDDLPPARRARLEETLLAWLDFHGHGPSIAERLHVHVQTVRYRVSQLRDVLGETLDDPQARFDLALALRLNRMNITGPVASETPR